MKAKFIFEVLNEVSREEDAWANAEIDKWENPDKYVKDEEDEEDEILPYSELKMKDLADTYIDKDKNEEDREFSLREIRTHNQYIWRWASPEILKMWMDYIKELNLKYDVAVNYMSWESIADRLWPELNDYDLDRSIKHSKYLIQKIIQSD